MGDRPAAGVEPVESRNAFRPACIANESHSGVYNGWSNAITLNNGKVEAVVVPEIGRIIQFRFSGTTNGVFWESARMRGLAAGSSNYRTDAASFGGDKAWPAPQSDWGWPPVVGFDCIAYTATTSGSTVTFTGPVDNTFGIQVTRTVELDADQPIMRVKTVFKRTAETKMLAKPVGIWVDTQVKEPVRIFAPKSADAAFTNGFLTLQGRGMPSDFQDTNGLISFTRDTAASHKVGFDGSALAWVGADMSMRMESPRVRGLALTNYPDGGCSTEIYTPAGGNAPYIEMEVLGRSATCRLGNQSSIKCPTPCSIAPKPSPLPKRAKSWACPLNNSETRLTATAFGGRAAWLRSLPQW